MLLLPLSAQNAVEQSKFFHREKPFGLHDGHDRLVECGQAAIPFALFVTKRLREGLQISHARHFVDAIDEQRGWSVAQKENQPGGCRWEPKMRSAADNVMRGIATANRVTHFRHGTVRNFLRCSGQAIHAADFLD